MILDHQVFLHLWDGDHYIVELGILYQYLMADLFFFYEYQGSSKVLDYYGYGDTGFERGCLFLTLANEYLAN